MNRLVRLSLPVLLMIATLLVTYYLLKDQQTGSGETGEGKSEVLSQSQLGANTAIHEGLVNVEAESDPLIGLEKTLLDELPGYSNCEADSSDAIRYFYNDVDLDDDRVPEIIVHLVGSHTCGSGGCTTLILQENAGAYRTVSTISLVNNPIVVSEETTNGWRDLIVTTGGGGMASASRRLTFNGRKYPENPTVESAIEGDIRGTAYIANEITATTSAPALLSAGCEEKLISPFAFMENERLGELHIAMTEKQVISLLGEPGSYGEGYFSEADGFYHQEWRYSADGITLDMLSDDEKGIKSIASILIDSASSLKTARGIGLGEGIARVQTTYADQLDLQSSRLPDSLVAGSIYGGMLFRFEDGQVTSIFLGAMAE